MTKRFLTTCVLVCGFALAALAVAAGLDGKWAGKTQFDGNDLPLTYNFKVDGDKVTGTAESPYGVSPIDNGKLKDNVVSFTTNVNGMEIPQTGKVYADSVALDISVNGSTIHANLTRAK